jgi:Ca2+-binding RTX toxin-like protein
LQGLGGNDHLAGGPGNDALYGGIGIDTALYSGPRASYGMTPSAADYSVSGPEGTDVLSGIERLQFSDGILALDTQSGGHTFDAYALFNAGFNRAPTVAEISRWTAERDQSFDINALAQKMIDFYAPGISDEALVKHLYFTITGTPAPQSAIDLYTGLITNGTYTQASLLSMAAQLDLNTNEFVSLIGQGVALDPSYFGG